MRKQAAVAYFVGTSLCSLNSQLSPYTLGQHVKGQQGLPDPMVTPAAL